MNREELIKRLQKILVDKLDLYLENGLWNCDGNIYLSNINLNKLPLKFGRVEGDFICSDNQLTTLQGCPIYVGGDFDCDGNRLKNLIGAPNTINCHFICSYNELSSLHGCPTYIGGDFYCDNNNLTTLEGCIESLEGDFLCQSNQLTSLDGGPKSTKDYYCMGNSILLEKPDWLNCKEFYNA